MYIIYQLFLEASNIHTREGFTFALRAHTAAEEGRDSFHLFPIKTLVTREIRSNSFVHELRAALPAKRPRSRR